MLCFQEIHLVEEQLYAFQLHAQSYDWFFSLGSSNSAGVAIAICKSLDITVNTVASVGGQLLSLDLIGQNTWRLINVYALNNPNEHATFIDSLSSYIVQNTILIGDFNSTTSPSDR